MFNARHRLAERYGLRLDQVEHLLDRYGTETVTLLDRIEAAPELSRPLPGAADHLAVEVLSAVEAEGVPHLDDVLARRTRISIQTRDRGLAAAEPTARLMGRALGWTQSELTREVNAYGDAWPRSAEPTRRQMTNMRTGCGVARWTSGPRWPGRCRYELRIGDQ